MTNEEKAVKIIGCSGRDNCLKCGGRLSVENGCRHYSDIIEMAKWKDKQMTKKACDFIKQELNKIAMPNKINDNLTSNEFKYITKSQIKLWIDGLKEAMKDE